MDQRGGYCEPPARMNGVQQTIDGHVDRSRKFGPSHCSAERGPRGCFNIELWQKAFLKSLKGNNNICTRKVSSFS